MTGAIGMKLPQAFSVLGLALPGLANRQATPRHSPASRLAGRLRPLSFTLNDFRSQLHGNAVPLDKEIQQLAKNQSLSGRWKKDKQLSEPMHEACELVQLPWVLRKALLVLDTLEVHDTGEYFETNIKAGGIMDVVERYPWTGQPVEHPRRDKRRGRHTAYVTRSEGGEPCIVCTWQDPHGGDCTDTFALSDCGNLLIQSSAMTIRGSGRSTQYKTVYRRAHK